MAIRKKLPTFITIGLILLGTLDLANADSGFQYDHYQTKSFSSKNSFKTFYTYESNSVDDYITGIGIGFNTTNKHSKFGIELTTTLNNASVLTTDGFIEEFSAWEGSIRYGYFSDAFVYAEVGIDLTELLFKDIRNDNNFFRQESDNNSEQIDAFIGIGAGINIGKVKLEGFTRLREIDSPYWQADSNLFTGVQFSIRF